jgi:TRAP-type C4-dicarboxylate transport system permease small subunit
MKRIMEWFDRFFTIVCVVLVLIMTVVVILSVALRYFFMASFVLMDEIIIYSFIASTFLGTALCVTLNENVRIDNILQTLPLKLGQSVEIIMDLLVVLLHVMLIKISIGWIVNVGGVVVPGFQVPIKYFYVILPISAGIVIFYQIRKVVKIIRSFGKPQSEPELFEPEIGG